MHAWTCQKETVSDTILTVATDNFNVSS